MSHFSSHSSDSITESEVRDAISIDKEEIIKNIAPKARKFLEKERFFKDTPAYWDFQDYFKDLLIGCVVEELCHAWDKRLLYEIIDESLCTEAFGDPDFFLLVKWKIVANTVDA